MFKLIFLSFFIFSHPVHVSMMGIEYSRKADNFNVFLKLYYNDFILDYRNSINDDQDFDPSGKIDTAIIQVVKYFNHKVQIFADDKKLEGNLISIASDNGELKMNFLISSKGKARVIKVKNQILTTLYQDQSNLLIFKYDDFEEGFKLTSDKMEQTFNLK